MLKKGAATFAKNFYYSVSSNLVLLLTSALVLLFVPRIIEIESYGYWQLFIFYSAYVPLLTFGWTDGVYLIYGGAKYEDLDKRHFFSQFYSFLFSQIFFSLAIVLVSFLFVKNPDRLFILYSTALFLVLVNARYMLLFILQATYRIKDYAQISIFDRVFYFLLVAGFVASNQKDYRLLIGAEILAKSVSLAYAAYLCRDIVIQRFSLYYFKLSETLSIVTAGIKLLFSNVASMLMIGSIRLGIERVWDVSTFGKVSLTLSISKFVMIFINAVGLVLFPVLRRMDSSKYQEVYASMRTLLLVGLLGLLLFYYPIKLWLDHWLPNYTEGLVFLAFLFPISVFEGKMALLINTFLKTLRKEGYMMRLNLISLAISIIIATLTTYVLKNLNMAILSIVVIMAIRSSIAEIYLSKILKISKYKNIVLELSLTIVFITTAWFMDSWWITGLYAIAFSLFLLVKLPDILQSLKTVKNLVFS